MNIIEKIDNIVMDDGIFGNSLKKIAQKAVIQGNHFNKEKDFFKVLIDAHLAEFTEDNKPTAESFLREVFEKALKESITNYYK